MQHIKTITGITAMLASVAIGRDPWPWALLFAAGAFLMILDVVERQDSKGDDEHVKRV